MESNIFQILNHQLAQYQQLHLNIQQKNHIENQEKDDEDPPPSYHTQQSSMVNDPNGRFTFTKNNNMLSSGQQSDNPYQIESTINEDMMQRQFNLYRYYVSQYPELFQEYFQRQRFQQEQPTTESDNNPYQQQNQDADNHIQLLKLSNNKKSSNNNNKRMNGERIDRCRLLCRCSKCCQSDSSIWSEQSQNDLIHHHHNETSMMEPLNQTSSNNTLYYLNANHLLEDERYEHLSRVITPPNAFLSNKTSHLNRKSMIISSPTDHQQKTIEIIDNDNFHYDTSIPSKPVLYSDKRTQTDSVELVQNGKTGQTYQTVDKLCKRLQRQLSLIETPEKKNIQNYGQLLTEKGPNRLSFESSDHIYYTIRDPQNESEFYTKKNFNPKSTAKMVLADQSNLKSFWKTKPKKTKSFDQNDIKKLERQNIKSHIQTLYKQNFQDNVPKPHRIPTSKDGIPCSCERCRESRGMNLTTELLPIDTQIPLQTMDNMDSFFQDSSMAELICTIM